MAQHTIHDAHDHTHGAGCGHKTIAHEEHTDYLHDGHMHHVHGDHVDEHALAVGPSNPAACTSDHACEGHDNGHRHHPECGHQPVPHGDHVDYVVHGHLHYQHGAHCDNHGAVTIG
ncbi:MAG: hypothetical protein ACREJU_06870 [Nitrospiraceae bacterium]